MKELAIYFENGHVAYFKNVENFQEYYDEDLAIAGIEFDYFGVTSQRQRHAKFEYYAGYSITTD